MRNQGSTKAYLVDGLTVNSNIIDEAIKKADSEGKRSEALQNAFQLVSLLEDNQKQPGSQTQKIKDLVNKGLVTDSNKKVNEVFLNPQARYPMSKAGGLGKIEKTCKIVDKGLLEYEDRKEGKVKEIVNFLNKIEVFNGNKNQKLDWHTKGNAFPYRVILIDSKQHQKALYFKNKANAEKVRIFYANKFEFKGNATATMKEINETSFKNAVISYFTKKVVQKRKELFQKQTVRHIEDMGKTSLENNPKPTTQFKEEQIIREPLPNVVTRQSNPRSQQGYDSNYLNELLEKEQQKSRLSVKSQMPTRGVNFASFIKLEHLYKKNLMNSWKEQAKQVVLEKSVKMSKKGSQRESRMEKSSKKEVSSVFDFKKASFLRFCSLEFLQLHNPIVKPIINVLLLRKGNIQQELVFNTLLKAKDPHLQYQLVGKNPQQKFYLKSDISEYQLGIDARDYLTDNDLCSQRINLKTKAFSRFTLLMNNEKTIRLEVNFENGQWNEPEQPQVQETLAQGNLQLEDLSFEVREKIRSFWEAESTRKQVYNSKKDVKLLQILQLTEDTPISWSLGLNIEEYKLVELINKAAKIIGFKITPSILSISRALKKLYSDTEQLIDTILSIVVNYTRPYFFPSEFEKLQQLHLILGLQGEIEFSSKISLQMDLIKKLIQLQCPQLQDKFNRRNIQCVHLLYQYTYELFSRNLPINTLVEFWNFVFKNNHFIQLYFVLFSVWLCSFYSKKLMRCHKLKDVAGVLESLQTPPPEMIIREVIILREKYFKREKNQSVLAMTKPLESVVVEFYKKQTQKIDKRKQNREIEKGVALRKLGKQLPLELPKYRSKSYCLHLYFYRLPPVAGSLYIKTNSIEYECLNFEQNRYVVIGNISTEVNLEFINNKSNEYSCRLKCIEGVNRFSVDLVSSKDGETYRVEYLCGLLDHDHIETLKKNKRFSSFVGPFITQKKLTETMMKEVNESEFLNLNLEKLEKDDLGNKIKVLFTHGNKNFDQLELYMGWIVNSSLSLKEKLYFVKELGSNLSEEYFLSSSRTLQKILMNMFLSMSDFPISPEEFQCFYADSVDNDFDVPNILKCRFVLPSGRHIKLEALANKYFCEKSSKYLYGDIIVDELLEVIKPALEDENWNEGTLMVLFSSNGEVHLRELPIIKKKHNKEISVYEEKTEGLGGKKLQEIQPTILVSEILPAFNKIGSILDLLNQGGKNPKESQAKLAHHKNPEKINLLKNCDEKMNRVLFMRFREHPTHISIPFMEYYHELIFDARVPPIPKNVFINNTRTDIKTICTLQKPLTFSDNKRIDENTVFQNQIGLFGNMRKLSPKTDSVYFFTVNEETKERVNAFVFMNYGFGIYKWEPCIVRGFRKKEKKESEELKKEYLVSYKGRDIFVREGEVKMKAEVEENLVAIESLGKSRMKKFQKTKSLMMK